MQEPAQSPRKMKSSTSVAERVGGLNTTQGHVIEYLALATGLYLSTVIVASVFSHHNLLTRSHVPPADADEILAMCQPFLQTLGPPEDFLSCTESDFMFLGRSLSLIKNATNLGWQRSRDTQKNGHQP